jgi:ABC-type transporter Mla maintaining outer membrane lipid asymmetry ATPase subunit MlaF
LPLEAQHEARQNVTHERIDHRRWLVVQPDRVVVLCEGGVIYSGSVERLAESQYPHIQEFLDMDRVKSVGV